MHIWLASLSKVYFNVTRTANYILNHVAFINITQLKHNLLKSFVSSNFNHPQYVYPKKPCGSKEVDSTFIKKKKKKKKKKKNMGRKSVETAITAIVFIVSLHCNQSYARFSTIYNSIILFLLYLSVLCLPDCYEFSCSCGVHCRNGFLPYIESVLKGMPESFKSFSVPVILHHCNQ